MGRLEWISTCVPLGRLHTKRVYADFPIGCRNNWKMTLSATSRRDLGWWQSFLADGVQEQQVHRWASFDHPLAEAASVRMYSDASGEIGFGGYCQGEIVAGLWADHPDLKNRSSSWKEWVPVWLLLSRVAPKLAPGTIVVVTTDNQANAFALNHGTAGEESFELVAAILLLAESHHLRVVGDWINRERIPFIDLLSRLDPMPGSAYPGSHAEGEAHLQQS